MDNATKWAERVAAWKASGLTSTKFCEGKPFTAGGLRHWAYRLRGKEPRKAPAPIRLARVVRRRVPSPLTPVAPEAAGAHQAVATSAEVLVLDCRGMRLLIRPGFDRGTLAAVLDVLAARGGAQ